MIEDRLMRKSYLRAMSRFRILKDRWQWNNTLGDWTNDKDTEAHEGSELQLHMVD